MTTPLTLRDILLLAIAVFACVAVAYFIVVLKRLKAVAEEVEKTVRQVRELIPKMDRLTHESIETLRAVREVVESSRGVVSDASALSAKVRMFAEEGLGYVAVLMDPLRKLAALVTGIQMGFNVFKDWKQRLLGRTNPEQEDDDEERNH